MTQAALIGDLRRAFWCAAERLLYAHAAPWELDEALVAWGYGTGPCEAQDHAGLDHVMAALQVPPTPVLPRMVAEGRLGRKGGVGYYRYPGGGGAVIDPLIEDLIREEAWFHKTDRSDLPDAELVAGMHDALRPVLSQALAAGIAASALPGLLAQAVHYPEDRGLAPFALAGF